MSGRVRADAVQGVGPPQLPTGVLQTSGAVHSPPEQPRLPSQQRSGCSSPPCLWSTLCAPSHAAPAPAPAAAPKLVYLLGADDYSEADVPPNAFVVYQARQAAGSPPALWRAAGRLSCPPSSALRHECLGDVQNGGGLCHDMMFQQLPAPAPWPESLPTRPRASPPRAPPALRRATTATAAPRELTWCCPPPPTPRSTRPT